MTTSMTRATIQNERSRTNPSRSLSGDGRRYPSHRAARGKEVPRSLPFPPCHTVGLRQAPGRAACLPKQAGRASAQMDNRVGKTGENWSEWIAMWPKAAISSARSEIEEQGPGVAWSSSEGNRRGRAAGVEELDGRMDPSGEVGTNS